MVLRRRDHWRRSPAARDRTLPLAPRLSPAGPDGAGGDPGRFRGGVDQWAEAELPRLYFELPFVGMAISSASSRRRRSDTPQFSFLTKNVEPSITVSSPAMRTYTPWYPGCDGAVMLVVKEPLPSAVTLPLIGTSSTSTS